MYVYFLCDKVGCGKKNYIVIEDNEKIYDTQCTYCDRHIHEPVLLEQEPFDKENYGIQDT
jgi:hypothetical protein